ncbi:unnamed protein product [Lymnaea stagnalis]|uniref:Uncharacterized protein n=1 Tax=Lymnaea stagnalis TaxID=6523 RepID=A0AAV2HS80_LYMST
MKYVCTIILLTVLCKVSVASEIKDKHFDGVMDAMFPGLFKTQEEIENLIDRESKINRKISKYGIAANRILNERRSDHHACCISDMRPADLERRVVDVNGKAVTLVELAGRKQFIPDETCTSVPNCRACPCTCKKINQTFSVLVYNFTSPHNASFTLVSLPTVCRCQNNSPQPSPARDLVFPNSDDDLAENPGEPVSPSRVDDEICTQTAENEIQPSSQLGEATENNHAPDGSTGMSAKIEL